MQLRDRIKEFRRVPASALAPNPLNWRTHPGEQRDAFRGLLAEVGIAGAVVCYETPEGLRLIDGHLRVEEIGNNAEIPALILDVTEDEAKKLLATFDTVSGMAGIDAGILDGLLRDVRTDSGPVSEMLRLLAESAGMFDVQPGELPPLRSGEKSPLQQMTFTLHDTQAASLLKAMELATAEGEFDTSINENRNGNALGRIAERYLEYVNGQKPARKTNRRRRRKPAD